MEHANKGRYIAIGWEKIGNLGWLIGEADEDKARSELTKAYRKIYGGSEVGIGISCGILINFVRQIKEGDIVVIPDMARRRVLMGRVSGSYEYKDNWGDECPYPHRKNVEWIKETDKGTISPKLKGSLYSWLTVFSLQRHKQEIMVIIGERPELKEKIVTGGELARVVTERIFNLAPGEFEHFVTHLLTLVGFEATTTQLVSDKGVDVIGTLNPEGLTNVTLKAQVRRVRSNIGISDILMLRGTLGVDEHGVFITTSVFTKQAQREAEGKKPIALIDREALVDLILEHYDELDENYKQFFALRKREVPLRERFYTTVMTR
ncbi:restriction endonuclease [Dehalococcoidales bacterium]|nr:restriction endonuclease [Dehalococcoidales bacterium]